MAGILQGFLNTDLDETGIRQAECAAERLRDEKFDCIFSSDLKRAMQTAQIIARFHDLEVVPVKELRDFAKVSLQPGETKTVTFVLNKRSFAYYNETAGDWFVESGEYR